jgi:hypothetical protein
MTKITDKEIRDFVISDLRAFLDTETDADDIDMIVEYMKRFICSLSIADMSISDQPSDAEQK